MPLVHTGRQQITVDKHGLDADRGKLLKQTVGLTDQYPMRRKRTHLPTNPPFSKGGNGGISPALTAACSLPNAIS
ncbi:hypothetical protein MELA_01154 [Candidatus Methylomirabilis lanthanidiphila]|uniref:Uncharacterized protein n=1 Tax=Candidatus Methylomirabilis lanthanidiphila TaxID=2211376 RepID=A0A564ZHG5_9BACT|nr:hypothetical protein MELA_01154 [Candidatus Methylomirabilis lanthanidiphila]